MAIIDWLLRGGRRRPLTEAEKRGMEVVPLADRTPDKTVRTILTHVDEVNHDGRPRQLEIAECEVGDELILAIEPRPSMRPVAVSVWSPRTGGQLGYVAVDAAAYLGINAKRYDFRSTIVGIDRDDDGNATMSLLIELFAKQR